MVDEGQSWGGPHAAPTARRLLSGFAHAAVVSLALAVLGAAVAHATSTQPVYGGDFPDPYVTVGPAGRYYAYSTQVGQMNMPMMTSTDLATWTLPIDALPKLPSWAAWGHTWAPAVAQRGAAWLMWYTTRHATWGVQCISLATAASPTGPFVDASKKPFVCRARPAPLPQCRPSPRVQPEGGALSSTGSRRALRRRHRGGDRRPVGQRCGLPGRRRAGRLAGRRGGRGGRRPPGRPARAARVGLRRRRRRPTGGGAAASRPARPPCDGGDSARPRGGEGLQRMAAPEPRVASDAVERRAGSSGVHLPGAGTLPVGVRGGVRVAAAPTRHPEHRLVVRETVRVDQRWGARTRRQRGAPLRGAQSTRYAFSAGGASEPESCVTVRLRTCRGGRSLRPGTQASGVPTPRQRPRVGGPSSRRSPRRPNR